MGSREQKKVGQLIQKGVNIPLPDSVFVADDVDTDRIAGDGVVICPGSRILGEKTLIMPGAKLGHEGPVTLEDCQVGPHVELRGGYFRRSVFLEKASMGSGAHVRDGCILEEGAGGAHTVGLKQTVLFPFVRLGSLVNFCDCFMSGGTSRRDHSEVGSSYIHFNFTPNQDKATPSLIGDVPRGVMLNQRPVFLGGQGGLVGPVRIEYGTVIAAGVVWRVDSLDGERLLLDPGPVVRDTRFYPGLYWHVKTRVFNNVCYIGNLMALRQWYLMVRARFLGGDSMGKMLLEGLLEAIGTAIEERIERFKRLSEKMPESAETYRAALKRRAGKKLLSQKKELHERWDDVEASFRKGLENEGEPKIRDPFLEEIERQIKDGTSYLSVVQGLDEEFSARGTAWLQGIVDDICDHAMKLLPSYSAT
jgi:UDP-N-acetylglucosamine/UDP-N-acetylgalactosamine diphosphorylase